MSEITTSTLAAVTELRRHPVKSLRGESLDVVAVDGRGIDGDRAYGVFDRATGLLLSAKRLPQMLGATARFVDGAVTDDALEITLPDGSLLRGVGAPVHAALSAWLGRDVELRPATPDGGPSSVEVEIDLDDPSQVVEFETRPGLLFDGAPLHLLSAQSLAAARALHPQGVWTVDRFRAGIVLEAPAGSEWPEDEWVGSDLAVGTVAIHVRRRCFRCVLTTRAVGDAPADKEILRTLAAHHGTDLGITADVIGGGTIAVGDAVRRHP